MATASQDTPAHVWGRGSDVGWGHNQSAELRCSPGAFQEGAPWTTTENAIHSSEEEKTEGRGGPVASLIGGGGPSDRGVATLPARTPTNRRSPHPSSLAHTHITTVPETRFCLVAPAQFVPSNSPGLNRKVSPGLVPSSHCVRTFAVNHRRSAS